MLRLSPVLLGELYLKKKKLLLLSWYSTNKSMNLISLRQKSLSKISGFIHFLDFENLVSYVMKMQAKANYAFRCIHYSTQNGKTNFACQLSHFGISY